MQVCRDIKPSFNPLAGKSELRPLVVKALPSKGSRSGFRPPLMLNSLRAENQLPKIDETLTEQGNYHTRESVFQPFSEAIAQLND